MGGFVSDSTREQVRAASDIVEIIGAVVPLKRAGATFKGLCPFHREKTPSFNVTPSKQMFKCFGCGKGGDVFRFIMDYENITFPEALRRLAERAHIEIKEDETPGAGDSRMVKDKLLTIHEQLTQRWQMALNSDPGAQIARDYLEKRGVLAEAVKLFRIGYAPEAWDDTVNWAKSKDFDLEMVALAGLVVKKDTGGFYDRFRGRLMFPICDEQGRVVAFSGRILKEEKDVGKYVNSPETPLFTKGRIIFGLDKAKRAILDRQFAVVCEGQLDMIACYMAGVENTVAPQGTAFTGEQARLLKRYTKEVVLCFDSDSAGQKAAVRALDDLIQSGLAIRVVSVPAPHDPDSFIKEFGADAFTQLVQKGVGYFDFYLDLLCKQNEIATDRGQKEIARAMASALDKTGDQILFDRYARQTALRLGVDPVQAVQGFHRLARAANPPRPQRHEDEDLPQEPEEPDLPRPSLLEFWIMKYALLWDDHLEWLAAHLDFHWIDHPSVREILELRLSPLDGGRWPEPADIFQQLHEEFAQNLVTEATMESRPINNPFDHLNRTLLRIRNEHIDRQLVSLTVQTGKAGLSEAEQSEMLSQKAALFALRTQPLAPVSDAAEF